MDIDDLLRKLQPLLPVEVAHWRRQRATATPDVRALIDRHVIDTAYEHLGDPERPLLSLPTEKKARGPIELGRIQYVKERHALGLRLPEVLQHTGLFGRSGSGKTNALFVLLEQLILRGVTVLFWDFKRTGRAWIMDRDLPVRIYTPGRIVAPFAFELFAPPAGLEREEYWEHVIDVLASAYTLGDGARSVLRKGLERAGARPTVRRVLKAVMALPENSRSRAWKTSAVRALESIVASKLDAADGEESVASALLHESSVIELDALAGNARKCLIPLLCLYLFYSLLAARAREQLRLVVVIEEAHHVLGVNPHRGRETLLERLLRESRELGGAFMIATQEPSQISSAVLANIHTSIILNVKNPADRRKAAGLSGLKESEQDVFANLAVGEAVVRLQGRWTKPVLVQLPLVPVEKRAVPDGDVQAWNQALGAGSPTRGHEKAGFSRVRPILNHEEPLGRDALRLVEDITRHPDGGVRERYQRLGLTSYAGTKLQRELLTREWIKRLVIPTGNSRKVVLVLTSKAQARLGAPRRLAGGVEHAYWQDYYARHLQSQGWHVTTEAPRIGGRVDVLAERDEERVGVEIETGRSHVAANVRNGLRSGFMLVIVCSDDVAFAHAEQDLMRAGLFLPGRVTVCLREEGLRIGTFGSSSPTSNTTSS